MNKIILSTFAFAVCLPTLGGAQSLQEQISAVDSIMTQQAAKEAAAQEIAQKKEAAAKAKAQRRFETQQALIRAERAKDKQRAQAYEDKKRELEIEDVSLDLEAKRAKVKRVNEYIDQDLKSQAAHTDVIQSEADAVRNVSSGIGDKLKSQGRAEERKAKKLF